MRLIFLSDTHGIHESMKYNVRKLVDPKQENVLIHAGDNTNVGEAWDIRKFSLWLQGLNEFDHKIFIAGNHDFGYQTRIEEVDKLLTHEDMIYHNVTYLQDNEFLIPSTELSRPLKVYGSPWQPWFHDWAFNLPRNGWELEVKWDAIPDDTDILITHGPPHGQLDSPPNGIGVGCEILAERVMKVKPMIHAFGHIHHSYGVKGLYDIIFINASICTERYKPTNKPIIVDVHEIDGKMFCEVQDI